MNGNKLFVDTNIILYLLSGDETISKLLHEKSIYLSFITQLELLGFKALSKQEESIINALFDQCTLMDINNPIKEKVIEIRQKYAIKLPDAVIAASAIYLDLPLITADSAFKKVEELDLLFYDK